MSLLSGGPHKSCTPHVHMTVCAPFKTRLLRFEWEITRATRALTSATKAQNSLAQYPSLPEHNKKSESPRASIFAAFSPHSSVRDPPGLHRTANMPTRRRHGRLADLLTCKQGVPPPPAYLCRTYRSSSSCNSRNSFRSSLLRSAFSIKSGRFCKVFRSCSRRRHIRIWR